MRRPGRAQTLFRPIGVAPQCREERAGRCWRAGPAQGRLMTMTAAVAVVVAAVLVVVIAAVVGIAIVALTVAVVVDICGARPSRGAEACGAMARALPKITGAHPVAWVAT